MTTNHLLRPMMNRVAFTGSVFVLAVFLTFMPRGVGWAKEYLDDSLSPQTQFSQSLRWAHQDDLGSLKTKDFFMMEGTLSGVEVRLDTSRYNGRRARIYFGLPNQIEGYSGSAQFTLSWVADRIFSPGEVRPGSRTLIYDGLIDSDLLIEIFTFTIRINAKYLTGKLRYVPIYEIETY